MRSLVNSCLAGVVALTVASSAAPAQTGTVRAMFEKHNLIGIFAFDCSKPVGRDNRYFVHRPLGDGQVQRDMMSGPTTRDFAVIWEQATELRLGQIALTGTRDQQPLTSTYQIEANRMRVLESTVAGKKEIAGGRFSAGGWDTPWAYRCDAPPRR